MSKRAKASAPISIKATGLLNNKQFLKELSVSDRRDLTKMRSFFESFNDLFDRVRREGGSAYMDMVDIQDGYIESLELYRDCQKYV